MPVQLIDVPIYNTTMRIPVAYLKGYQHPNCYPGLIPGKTAYSGILEQRAQACLLRWYLSVNPASIFPPLFIDVGCADGVYSVLAKQRGFEVIGFDPVAGLCELYRHNTGGECFNVALSDSDESDFYIGKWGTHIIRVSETPDEHHEKIPSAHLDAFSLCPEIIKIDTEGMAAKVLRGGAKTVEQVEVLVIELHSTEEFEGVSIFLNEKDWKWQFITETHLIAVKPHMRLPMDYEEFRISD